MSRADLSRSVCTVARATEVVGEAWTLMILREMFLGVRRFAELQRMTGAAPHTLSQRLDRLEAEGIVRRERYQDHPPRDEYRLTAKGRDLWPVVMALKAWGDRWLEGAEGDPVRVVHRGCGHEVTPRMTCPECGEAMAAADAVASISEGFREERERRRARGRTE